MDAYSDYVMRMSRGRIADLQRDAEMDRLARIVRARSGSRLQQLRQWFLSRRSSDAAAPPVTLPAPSPTADAELRRSA